VAQFMLKTVYAADLGCDPEVALNFAIADITAELGKHGWRVEFPIVRSADMQSADVQFAKD
jgi:hypothetical protein